jgi:hypothetical protein
MEFRYPKWHEQPDLSLVERHQREIFPLLRKRYLFAEAINFRLYDFYNEEGFVNEDVFAYSNQAGDQRALVVFHNRFSDVRGWIRLSAAYPVKTGQGDEKILVQSTLGEALGLHDDPNSFVIFRNHLNGLEYLRSSQALVQQGLYLELNAYKSVVFSEFREVEDNAAHTYAQLNASLDGAGVPSIAEALREHELRHLLVPYRDLVNPGMLQWMIQNRVGAETYEPLNMEVMLAESDQKVRLLLSKVKEISTGKGNPDRLALEIVHGIESLLTIELLAKDLPVRSKSGAQRAIRRLLKGTVGQPGLEGGEAALWVPLLCCLITCRLGKIVGEEDYREHSRKWIDEFLLGKTMVSALGAFEMDAERARRAVDLVRILTLHQGWIELKTGVEQVSKTASKNVSKTASTPAAHEGMVEAEKQDDKLAAKGLARTLIQGWLADETARRFLRIHSFEEILWFNRESFEELVWWTFALEVVLQRGAQDNSDGKFDKALGRCDEVVEDLLKAEERSGYQVEKLLQILEEDVVSGKTRNKIK